MDPSLVYVPSLIFQITYSCLNELNEQMEVLCRLCEYQVILLPFLVTGICCSMKLDIWKWLILDSGNFWMPHLHKRICIQWRERLDHVRGTFFFTLVHGSIMVCYTWVWLYCCKWHDQWRYSYSCMKILEVDIFCKSSFPLFLIDQGLRVLVGFHLFNVFNFVTHVSGNWFYVFMLKQIDTWRQRCSCTRLMIRALMCSPLPSLFRRYWESEFASFSYDIEQSITSKSQLSWESQYWKKRTMFIKFAII